MGCSQSQPAPRIERAVHELEQGTEALEDNDVFLGALSRLRKRPACQSGGQLDGTGADEIRVLSFFSYFAQIGMV
jgi:hypothetical protein